MNLNIIIDRISRLLWCILAYCVRYFIPITKGKVICWAYSFKQYGCHPKYITEYILNHNNNDFSLVWVLDDNADVVGIPANIKIVRPHTLRYLVEIYSSQFIINNSRNYKYRDFFFKKRNQLYIMTWHGSIALKKIEYDAAEQLGPTYIRRMKDDNRICNLMLSNCQFFTDLIRNSFLYKGEILEKGVPRNDLFFDDSKKEAIKKRIWEEFDIPVGSQIVMYAPTFRTDGSSKHFELDWDKLISAFEKKMGSKIVVFLRLHPNSLKQIDINGLLNDKRVRNMCFYNDMQELLCVSDILITDYSSTMFEMGILNKICLLYADDVDTYDRGFYFDIRTLPFELAESEDQLVRNIVAFDSVKYQKKLDYFYKEIIKAYDNGHASESVVNWMRSHK